MDRRTFLATTAGLPLLGLPAAEPAKRASVTVDPAREIGRINPWIYGQFIEHSGRIVYGGVFDPGSRFSDSEGLRTDVITAIKEMGGAHVLRWPGGNFASYYRWRNGIGPRDKRPKKLDVVWNQYESNQFGTDEYLSLCGKLGCDPFIVANLGDGFLDEACEWVEYCRRPERQPPARVWGLGNEHFGAWQVGYYTPEEYGRKARQYGQFMRVVAPDIELLGVGNPAPEWNDGVLKHCGETIDWLTIHLYGNRRFLDGVDDFDEIVAAPELFHHRFKSMAEQLDVYEAQTKREKPIRMVLEEWDDRHYQRGSGTYRHPDLIPESPRNIVDVLFVAGVFNACHRMANRVGMGNYTTMTNGHQGVIQVFEEGIVKSALFDVFRLYSARMQPVAVAADVQTESFGATVDQGMSAPGEPVTAARLDVSATMSADGRTLALALINRYKEDVCRVSIECRGKRLAPGGVLHVVHADDLNSVNTLQYPHRVHSVTTQLTGSVDSLDLPAHSVSIVEMTLS